MALQYKVNGEIDRQSWIELIAHSNYSNPFHSPEYYDFINSYSGLRSDVHAILEENRIKVIIVVTIHKEKGLKGYFSRRGIIYGGPVIDDGCEDYLMHLLEKIGLFYKNSLIYIESRNSFSYLNFLHSFNEKGWKYQEHFNIHLLTKNKTTDELLSKMSYNRRREIKMSLKEGVIVELTQDRSEIEDIFNILRDLYNTRVKLPLPEINYFMSFIESTISKVFVVKHLGKVIGGAFCITDNIKTINTLYYCGIRNYNKKIFPTHIAILGVINYSIENGVNIVDFMGAGKPDIDYGVRDYKMQFGGDLVEYGRFIKVYNRLLYQIGKFGLFLFSKLKK